MRTTEMNILRPIAGKTRIDRVTNNILGEECGVADIAKFVKERRSGWNQQIDYIKIIEYSATEYVNRYVILCLSLYSRL